MLLAARLSFVLVLTLTIQTTWMAELRPLGVSGDLLLLAAITGGLVGGATRGATIGFVAGLALDLVLLSPLGLSALTYLAVGYVVGTVTEGVIRSAAWIPPAVAFVASILGVVFFVVVGQLVGQQFRVLDVPRIALVTAVINTVLVFPAMGIGGWVGRAAPDRMLRTAR